MARRFPTPWKVCKNEDAYWVEDARGKRFAFCYFRDHSAGHDLTYLSEDEARRITANVAKLPELLKR